MSVVYYYAKNDNLAIYLKYGIRLSKNYDKELNVNGYQKQYLIGYLHPKDDMNKYDSEVYTCIKLDVLDNHLKIVEKEALQKENVVKDFIAIEKYYFGTYKHPRVLIDTSVIADKITRYNKDMDIPLVYEDSETIFYNIQIQKIVEEKGEKEVYECLKNNM